MNSFISTAVLEAAIKTAGGRYTSVQYDGLTAVLCRMQPVVLVDYESALTVPGFGKFPEAKIARSHYCRNFLAEFLYDREFLGEEGKGTYGVAMYRCYDRSL